jgi:hypothetical protein
MGRNRVIDLSIGIEPDFPSDPPMMIPQIDYIDHAQGTEQMKQLPQAPVLPFDIIFS